MVHILHSSGLKAICSSSNEDDNDEKKKNDKYNASAQKFAH